MAKFGFHPVWRDYPISTRGNLRPPDRPAPRFHPVWRDYPISTCQVHPQWCPADGRFPSRLAGLSYFHQVQGRGRARPRGVSIPSGGIILFPPQVQVIEKVIKETVVSIPSGGIILFPLASYLLVQGLGLQVSIPSGGIILFPPMS